jgi:hypothetical protein
VSKSTKVRLIVNTSARILPLSAAFASLITPALIIGSMSGIIHVRDSLILLTAIIVTSLYTLAAFRTISVQHFNTQQLKSPLTLALFGLVLWLGASLITGPLLGISALPGEGMYQISTTLQVIFFVVASIGQFMVAIGLLVVSIRLNRQLGTLYGFRIPLRITFSLSGILLCAMSIGVLDAFARIFHHISVMAFLGFTIVYAVNAILLSLVLLFVALQKQLVRASSFHNVQV